MTSQVSYKVNPSDKDVHIYGKTIKISETV